MSKKSPLSIFQRLYITGAIIGLCAIFTFSSEVFGQSVRRNMTSPRLLAPGAPTTSVAAQMTSIPERDFDLFVGKIIRKDGEYVIVYVMSPNKISGRTPVYYSCDAKMTPTAILENTNIAHKACATFKVSQGSAIVGDIVMVKYLAPVKEEPAQERQSDGGK